MITMNKRDKTMNTKEVQKSFSKSIEKFLNMPTGDFDNLPSGGDLGHIIIEGEFVNPTNRTAND